MSVIFPQFQAHRASTPKHKFPLSFQIANAANYGAIAALLFSDPADFARAGPDPKDTYPNTAWLPASGVQRGSLYTFPGAGDPQTPGIAALPGMWRRSQNDSELPQIPAHPMGYGDAIHFLSKMGGNLFFLCGKANTTCRPVEEMSVHLTYGVGFQYSLFKTIHCWWGIVSSFTAMVNPRNSNRLGQRAATLILAYGVHLLTKKPLDTEYDFRIH